MGKQLSFCLYKYLLCRLRNKHFDMHLWQILLVPFPSKMEKAQLTKEELDGEVIISHQRRYFCL